MGRLAKRFPSAFGGNESDVPIGINERRYLFLKHTADVYYELADGNALNINKAKTLTFGTWYEWLNTRLEIKQKKGEI
jgi:hypothetical protein